MLKFMQKFLWGACLFLFSIQHTSAQLLTDVPTQQKIVAGLDALYNLDFATAERQFNQLPSSYDEHPVNDLLKAFVLQWKYLPIEQNSGVLKQYISYLEACQLKAERLAKKPEYKAEATFFLLASHGYVALSYNYRKEYTKAVMDASQAYGYLKDGFGFINQNVEFNFTTGLYNYYRIQYPETHPAVKPLLVFFQAGNKRTGLAQLRKAANNAVFSRIEASNYLVNVYIKYEADFPQALGYAQRLAIRYPKNYIFRIKYIETLLLNNAYEKAGQSIRFLSNRTDKISTLSLNFFEGYVAEKDLKNDELAAQKYLKTLSYPANGRYTQEYYALACLGLGRIMDRKGDTAKANYYYKKCLEHAEYTWAVTEAKQALKN